MTVYAGWVIPDLPPAPTPIQAIQSSPDSRDFQILLEAFRRNAVLSGCAVTQRGAGPTMTIDVAAGTTMDLDGDRTNTIVAINKAITAADGTNPRIDLIYTIGTTVSVADGTAGANPVFPILAAGSVCLSAVFVAVGQASILNDDIIDKRVFIQEANPAERTLLRAAYR